MPNYDECLVEAEFKARAAYSEPHRHYHDQRHLDECLSHVDEVDGLTERERQLLKWAVLWHDAVYDPGERDNEQRSAELALSELSRCGVHEDDAAEVARLILLTERHSADPGDRLGAVTVSIDLAILGSDPDRYREYAAGVRREYGQVSDADWRAGRSAVLNRLLSANPLFPDPDFRLRLEQQARRNMDQELKALAEG